MKLIRPYLLLPLLFAGCIDGFTSPEIEKRVFSVLGGLEVGEVLEFRGAAATDVPLAGGSEYLLVPFNASPREGITRLTVEFTGEQVEGLSAASRAPEVPGFLSGQAALPRRDHSVHDRIRASEGSLRRLIPEARSYRARRNLAARAAQMVPAEGDLIRLNVNSNSECLAPIYRDAQVMAVSQRAIVAADVQNPAGGFTAAEFRQLATAFDTLVWKVDTRNFGVPSDIDGNGRVTIFITASVNALTPRGAPNGYVAGYFWGRDLFPATTQGEFEGCAGSNQGEMFYIFAPDPQGTINGNVFTKALVQQSTVAVTAHEFEHLINSSRRMYVNDADAFEEHWLDEGLAHIAEEQVFYESSGLEPGMNLDVAQLADARYPRRADAANQFMLDNVGRYWSFLERPSRESLLGVQTPLETRGAIWSFLRYAADAQGGSDEELFLALANSKTTGMTTLTRVLKSDPIDLMQSWTASVYLDDLGLSALDAKYAQRSWNMRSLIGYFNDGVFPLEIVRLNSRGNATVRLKGGGSAYVTVAATAGHQGMIRTTSNSNVPPGTLRLSVVRLK